MIPVDKELDILSKNILLFVASLEPAEILDMTPISLYNTWAASEYYAITHTELVPVLLNIITDYKKNKTDGQIFLKLLGGN